MLELALREQSNGKLKAFLEIYLCSLYFAGSLFELLLIFLYRNDLIDRHVFNVYFIHSLRPNSLISVIFLGVVALMSGLCLLKFVEKGYLRIAFLINFLFFVAIIFVIYTSISLH